MLKDRPELNKYLEECVVKFVRDRESEQKICDVCYKKHRMPYFRTGSIIQLSASPEELRDNEIFWVLEGIREVVKYSNIMLEDYFTPIELENYSRMRVEERSVKFPLVLSMYQVNPSQWVGTVKAKDLVLWRGSILRYNKEIQRRLQMVVRGNLTYEMISLKKSAVKSMVSLFKQKKFIPNVITLNIDDLTTDYYYDEENKQLVINDIKYFDLTDGYHRLVALSKVLEEDPDFDYTMELRITAFSEEKAGQFIWQEEQRTKIPQNDIRSYNMDDLGNKLTRRINESSSCNLSGCIKRGGSIDFVTFSDMVTGFFLDRKMDEGERKQLAVTVPREMIDCLNRITEANPDLIDKYFNVQEIKILVYVCYKYYQKDKSDVVNMYKKLSEANYTVEERKSLLAVGRSKMVLKLLNGKFEELSNV